MDYTNNKFEDASSLGGEDFGKDCGQCDDCNDCFSIEECYDYEGNFDYDRLENAIMDGEYVPEDW